MTPESKFKKQLRDRWNKLYKHSKTEDWTAIPGVKGIPDNHLSIIGASAFMEVKVLPNGLNKNQQVMIPKLSYGTPVFVISKKPHPVSWNKEEMSIVWWKRGEPYPIHRVFMWADIAHPNFWKDL